MALKPKIAPPRSSCPGLYPWLWFGYQKATLGLGHALAVNYSGLICLESAWILGWGGIWAIGGTHRKQVWDNTISAHTSIHVEPHIPLDSQLSAAVNTMCLSGTPQTCLKDSCTWPVWRCWPHVDYLASTNQQGSPHTQSFGGPSTGLWSQTAQVDQDWFLPLLLSSSHLGWVTEPPVLLLEAG